MTEEWEFNSDLQAIAPSSWRHGTEKRRETRNFISGQWYMRQRRRDNVFYETKDNARQRTTWDK